MLSLSEVLYILLLLLLEVLRIGLASSDSVPDEQEHVLLLFFFFLGDLREMVNVSLKPLSAVDAREFSVG